ncbi:MAG TPA: hypothetical protein VD815_11615 [Candidatus Saccharimonadales bacterium]|nr:hypothetical protein [Candidatus Saccharimonadales bacterium]
MQEYAFKKNYNISQLFDAIINAFNIAAKWGTDLDHLEQHVHNKEIVLQGIESLTRKRKNDSEYLYYKHNIKLAEIQEYQRNKPTLQKFMNLINELDIEKSRSKLLENQNKTLKFELHKKEIKNERLNQLLTKKVKRMMVTIWKIIWRHPKLTSFRI